MMIDSARYPRLARIQTPDDLRTFDESELRAVADELRAYLIESVGKSGGHFAGRDRTHRGPALPLPDSGRSAGLGRGSPDLPAQDPDWPPRRIHTVKQKDGVAPFPKREESEYDTFGVGHPDLDLGGTGHGHRPPVRRRRPQDRGVIVTAR